MRSVRSTDQDASRRVMKKETRAAERIVATECSTGIDEVGVVPSFDDYAGSGLRRDEREKRCIALS